MSDYEMTLEFPVVITKFLRSMKGGYLIKSFVAQFHGRTKTLPSVLKVTATTQDDRTIMAVAHRNHPVYGLQFHPESVMTPAGCTIMKNFLRYGGEC